MGNVSSRPEVMWAKSEGIGRSASDTEKVCIRRDIEPCARGVARRRLSLALSLAIGLSGAFAIAPVAAQQTHESVHAYALPSQSLASALSQVASTSDAQVLIPPELVRNRVAPALTGRYTVREAITRLLAGSGLTFRVTPRGVIASRTV